MNELIIVTIFLLQVAGFTAFANLGGKTKTPKADCHIYKKGKLQNTI